MFEFQKASEVQAILLKNEPIFKAIQLKREEQEKQELLEYKNRQYEALNAAILYSAELGERETVGTLLAPSEMKLEEADKWALEIVDILQNAGYTAKCKVYEHHYLEGFARIMVEVQVSVPAD